MGELGAFLRLGRARSRSATRSSALPTTASSRPLPVAGSRAGRALHGVRRAVLPHGCPLNNLIPDWNDLVYRDRWHGGDPAAPPHQQLPRVHRAPVPGALRSRLRARDPRGRCRHDQADRARDHRPRLDEGWVNPPPPARERADRRSRRLGTRGAGRRPQLRGRGTPSPSTSATRRRAGSSDSGSRTSRSTSRSSSAASPAGRRGRRVPLRRRGRRRPRRGAQLRERLRSDRDRDGRARPARSAPCGTRAAGVHFAMEYLYQRNRWRPTSSDRPAGSPPPPSAISAAGKHVIVIGGGDTGADCVAKADREGRLGHPARDRARASPHRPDDLTPWPRWPNKLRLSYAMKEGAGVGELDFSIVTTHRAATAAWSRSTRAGRRGASLRADPGDRARDPGRPRAARDGLPAPRARRLDELGLERDPRGNIDRRAYATSVDGVFAAGDARRGQSLIVWAINEGRQCARAVERYLATLPALAR